MNIYKYKKVYNLINFNSDLDFLVTNKCNATCTYCDFTSLKNTKSINNDDLILIDYYMNYCISTITQNNYNKYISIIGGEIGLLDSDLLHELELICNKYIYKYHYYNKLNWCTNGLLIKNYPNILNNKDIIINYHIIDDDMNNFIPYCSDNIYYNIVLTEENENRVIQFIENHKNIRLKIKPCNDIRNGYNSYNKNNDLFKYKKFNNNLCNNKSFYFSLDFVKKTIRKCCKSYINFENKELTIENLNLAFDGKLFDKSRLCVDCKWFN